MKSDIKIAQEAVLAPIGEVAAKLDIKEDELECYGNIRLNFLRIYGKE